MALNLQFILGGARSGKSRFALNQGNEHSFERRIFLATASPGDSEMKKRIERHKKERNSSWKTIEEPYHLSAALEQAGPAEKDLMVIDCATLWISNMLCGMGGKNLAVGEIEKEFEKFKAVLKRHEGTVRIVSNEVGLGIVPDNSLARQFQDLQGDFNKSIAAFANQVILMTAGLPQKIK